MSLVFADLVRAARAALERAGIEDAPREARILAANAAGLPLDRASVSFDEPVSAEASARLNEYVTARAVRIPLSHILGRKAFFNHDFTVTPDVLDPRSDTERLVAEALEEEFSHVLDLGTGSGCILLSLLAARPEAAGVGTDISPKALDVALGNANRLEVADRCLFLLSDWLSNVTGTFDLIVSNPPYISADEMADMQPELTHEPRIALTDEGDGLSAYTAIIPCARRHLRPLGRLLVEIGWTQAPDVARLFEKAGYVDIAVLPDIEGRDRVVRGVWPGD